jgi:hypothetical protein
MATTEAAMAKPDDDLVHLVFRDPDGKVTAQPMIGKRKVQAEFAFRVSRMLNSIATELRTDPHNDDLFESVVVSLLSAVQGFYNLRPRLFERAERQFHELVASLHDTAVGTDDGPVN